LLHSSQDQIVYVIAVYAVHVVDPDGVCHFSIYYTGFRSRWCLSFQYLVYSIQDQMIYVISVYVIQLSGPDGVVISVYVIHVSGPDDLCIYFIYNVRQMIMNK